MRMEVDKLDDAQNSFQEDCDKFQKYMAEMEFKANRAKEDTDIVTAKKLEKEIGKQEKTIAKEAQEYRLKDALG